MKFLRKSRANLWLAPLGVFLVVFACLFVEWWWSQPRQKERKVCSVVSSEVALSVGNPISASRIRVHFEPAPADRRCEEIFFTESEIDASQSETRWEWVAAREISAGETLYSRDVRRRAKVRLPKGRRAFSVALHTTVDIAPGDHVDIYSAQSARAIVAAALVLQIARAGQASSAVDAVLALRQTEIRDMEKAAQKGTLSVALVHPADVGAASTFSRRQTRPDRAKIWHEE